MFTLHTQIRRIVSWHYIKISMVSTGFCSSGKDYLRACNRHPRPSATVRDLIALTSSRIPRYLGFNWFGFNVVILLFGIFCRRSGSSALSSSLLLYGRVRRLLRELEGRHTDGKKKREKEASHAKDTVFALRVYLFSVQDPCIGLIMKPWWLHSCCSVLNKATIATGKAEAHDHECIGDPVYHTWSFALPWSRY